MTWGIDVPLIAILRGIRPEEVLDHVGALLEEGFTAIEIPTNSPGWEESIARVVKQFGNAGLFGAGTVLQPGQVDALAAVGGRLVVTPNTCAQVIRRARTHGMTVCAGCATATEAFTAIESGAQILKIFPSSTFGPGYIHSLKAVLPPDVPVMAVGGVTPENLASWLQAGCAGAGLGSDLYRAGQPVGRTREQAQAFIAAWRKME
ncbi:2-dehydro-3-deoxy-6-phosphogalactonate aldolase [Kosakonia sp. H02]|nr:2-dehydro-3-deoxy-6-phosphogalactonate aldolase [Kosakonia sp. H02]